MELNKKNTHHTIASFYLAHDYEGPLPNTTTQQLIHTHSPKELILGGDANSHHTQLISDPLLNQLEAWKVGIEHSFSDHRYIKFTKTIDCPPAENITNLRLTNWGYFINLLSRNLHAPAHVSNGQELDTLVNTFTDICGEALKRACPSRTVKAKHKHSWWNATLPNLKRECRTYFNKAKYNNSQSSWN